MSAASQRRATAVFYFHTKNRRKNRRSFHTSAVRMYVFTWSKKINKLVNESSKCRSRKRQVTAAVVHLSSAPFVHPLFGWPQIPPSWAFFSATDAKDVSEDRSGHRIKRWRHKTSFARCTGIANVPRVIVRSSVMKTSTSKFEFDSSRSEIKFKLKIPRIEENRR